MAEEETARAGGRQGEPRAAFPLRLAALAMVPIRKRIGSGQQREHGQDRKAPTEWGQFSHRFPGDGSACNTHAGLVRLEAKTNRQAVQLRGVQCPTDIFPEDVSGQRVRGKMLNITNHQGFANPDHGEVSPRTCQNGCRQSADQQPEPVRTGTKGTLRTAAGTARRCGRRGRQAGGPSEGDAGTAGRPPGPPRGVCLKTPKARLRGDVRAPPCAAAAFQTPGCPPTGGWARDAAAPTAGFRSAVCRVDRPSGHRAK